MQHLRLLPRLTRRSSIVQIVELSPAPIASETGLKLLEEIDSGSPCSPASHARLRIDSLEGGQGLLHDISQLIVGERAILSSARSVPTLSMNAATPPPGRSSSIDMQAFRRITGPAAASEISREPRCPVQ